ncbi:PsbP-related protein [uncultured Methanolobus sp.]|uniref:PsbP-related protein n=1 Tax=uncultured Methanolobus sp. TaxID=218300 RepID=UPI002AABA380|nr:PsbP-related protein [uncultured Methanolobus sp.]
MTEIKKLMTYACVLCALLCAVLMTSGCMDDNNSDGTNNDNSNYATYSDSKNGFSVKYPDSWEKMEMTNRVTFKNNETNALANIAVLSMSSLGATSLEEVVDSYGAPGGEYTTFNGYEAYETIVSDPSDIDTRDILFVDGDRLFILSYISYLENEDEIETMNMILESIEVE